MACTTALSSPYSFSPPSGLHFLGSSIAKSETAARLADALSRSLPCPSFCSSISRAVFFITAFLSQLDSRLYEGAPPLQVAALPDAFNPLRWTGVVETSNIYLLSAVNPISQGTLPYPAIFYKPQITPALATAIRTDPFRYFLYFARFPVWSFQPVLGDRSRGTRLDLTDLRFGHPGAGSFHCVGYTNAENQLLFKVFTYSSGAELGWNDSRSPK